MRMSMLTTMETSGKSQKEVLLGNWGSRLQSTGEAEEFLALADEFESVLRPILKRGLQEPARSGHGRK